MSVIWKKWNLVFCRIFRGLKTVFEKKWYTFKPIGYMGMVFVCISILLNLLDTHSAIIGIISMLMLITGFAFILKGRKEHGL